MTEETKTEKTDKEQKPWLYKKGQSGNLEGRPLGTKNFDTIFREAIIRLAKDDDDFKKVVGKDIDEIDRKLVKKAIVEAMKGNLGYHKDIYDRRGLKPNEEIDVNITKKVISVDE